MTPHEEKKKNVKSIVISLIVMIIIIIAIGAISKSCSKETPPAGTDNVITQPKWELCWIGKQKTVSGTDQGKSIGLCGEIKEIRFDSEKEVLSMTVFYTTTRRTVFYNRKNAKDRGKWTQQGNSGGWWYLKKVPNTNPVEYEGKCRGNDRDDKVRRLILSKS